MTTKFFPAERDEVVPDDSFCDHYLDRNGVRYYCDRDMGHPHGHNAPDYMAPRGMFVQWLTGDHGDGIR